MTTDLIKRLLVPSVSGREEKIRGVIEKEAAPFADEIRTDNLGNLIVLKKGSSPEKDLKKLMFAAHMDEIGFIATFIDDKGFIRVSNIGGINWQSAAFAHVVFENGVEGILVPEAKASPNEYGPAKCVIDIGARDKKDAEKRVGIGDFAVVKADLRRLAGKRYSGRPLDDRIGCAVMLDTLARAEKCEDDVYFAFTVQEEVGLRGAGTAAFSIAPDYSVALDVTGTGDSPDARPMKVELGGGAAVKVKDSSVISDAGFVRLLKTLAKDNKIKYQLELLEAGGTDTAAMQRAGAGSIAAGISIPTRYIHSSVEEIDLGDVEACVRLCLALTAHKL